MLLKIETTLLKIETMLLKIETRYIRKNVPPPSRTNHIPHVQFAVVKPGVGVGTLRFRVRFRVMTWRMVQLSFPYRNAEWY